MESEEDLSLSSPSKLKQSASNYERRMSLKLDCIKDIIQPVLAEDKADTSSKLKLTVSDFTKAADAQIDEALSVLIKVEENEQTFETSTKLPVDEKKDKTVWAEHKELVVDKNGSMVLFLNDAEGDSFCRPEELNLEKMTNGQPYSVALKSQKGEKLGELTLSAEWVDLKKPTEETKTQ